MNRDKVFISISSPPSSLICIHLAIHHLAASAMYLREHVCRDHAAFIVGVYTVVGEFDNFNVHFSRFGSILSHVFQICKKILHKYDCI